MYERFVTMVIDILRGFDQPGLPMAISYAEAKGEITSEQRRRLLVQLSAFKIVERFAIWIEGSQRSPWAPFHVDRKSMMQLCQRWTDYFPDDVQDRVDLRLQQGWANIVPDLAAEVFRSGQPFLRSVCEVLLDSAVRDGDKPYKLADHLVRALEAHFPSAAQALRERFERTIRRPEPVAVSS